MQILQLYYSLTPSCTAALCASAGLHSNRSLTGGWTQGPYINGVKLLHLQYSGWMGIAGLCEHKNVYMYTYFGSPSQRVLPASVVFTGNSGICILSVCRATSVWFPHVLFVKSGDIPLEKPGNYIKEWSRFFFFFSTEPLLCCWHCKNIH